MIIKETTNRAEVLAYKKRKAQNKINGYYGVSRIEPIHVGNRPKPIYILREITTEQYNIEAFDRHCDKLEAKS